METLALINVHRDASVLTPTHSYCHPRAVDSLSATLDTRTHEMTGARQEKKEKKKKHPRIYILWREFSEVTVCSRRIKWKGLINNKKRVTPRPLPQSNRRNKCVRVKMRGIKEHLHRQNHKKRWKAERNVTFKRFVTAGGRNAAQACHLQPRSVSAPLTGKTNGRAKNITQSNACTWSLRLFSGEYYSICLSKTYGARHALSGGDCGNSSSSTNRFWSDLLVKMKPKSKSWESSCSTWGLRTLAKPAC